MSNHVENKTFGEIMVFLNRIYTKSGDEGQTGLGDGSRVSKDSLRVTAYGEVDELNSVLGIVLLEESFAEADVLRRIQNDLFDLGADLCVPYTPQEETSQHLRITVDQVVFLEKQIDRLNESLAPLRSFILPGGTHAAAYLHLARTVCRRAERAVVTLMKSEPINQQALIYLNRLSDLFFVMARYLNDQGKKDVLWVPGQSRKI
jgi:cob(I)alamin adenosyltransferase